MANTTLQVICTSVNYGTPMMLPNSNSVTGTVNFTPANTSMASMFSISFNNVAQGQLDFFPNLTYTLTISDGQ